ncbi:MAG: hypothetical protein KJO96_04760 [Winogradskyella sp.]|nr:hypothetical protein [Winogradskyella sp.]NNF85665.1 hypothetical protein [Winogradskyella sp.]
MMRYIVLFLVLVFSFSFTSCARRVVVKQPANVTVVKTLPRHYKVVRVNGNRYYVWKGKHYRKTKNGYVLVRL